MSAADWFIQHNGNRGCPCPNRRKGFIGKPWCQMTKQTFFVQLSTASIPGAARGYSIGNLSTPGRNQELPALHSEHQTLNYALDLRWGLSFT